MLEHINLNDDWKYGNTFCNDMTEISYDESNMETIRLPHSNAETPFHYFDEKIYQFISCYRKHICAKEEWKGKQVILTFEGIGHVARVYLNGTLITTHYGGYTAFSVDLAPYLYYHKDNVLVVEVDSRESNNLPPFGDVIDYLTYGGIYREVYLDIKEAISIEDIFVMANEEKEVDIQVHIHGLNKNTPLKLKYSLINESNIDKKVDQNEDKNIDKNEDKNIDKNEDKNNDKNVDENEDKTQNKNINKKIDKNDERRNLIYTNISTISDTISTISFEVPNAKIWDIENPNLYYLHIQLFDESSSLLDEKKIRFGFRTCEFKEDGFYLNHNKIKLVGLNRHQSFPYVGYAMPKRMQQRDAEILKQELQVNAVRTSHYPQSKHFIDRCDELGLLVFTEIPGWQHIGDEHWKEIACENVKDMIMQYRNHPAVILWGVRINESQDDDEFYTRTNQIAHKLDPTRQTGGVRYLKKSNLLEDVYTYNDFLHNGLTKGLEIKENVTSKKEAPYLVTEFNGHMFPTKSFDSEEHRLMHALRHARVLDAVFEQEKIAGGLGWCMFDYNTHKDFGSGDRICYHGVLDMFRNPKLAASVYASQNDNKLICEVSSTMDIGEHPASKLGEVYIFTNADCVKVYKNDTFIREFYPNKTRYSHLPHPPIIIDDFIGDLLERQEHFSHKSVKVLKEVFFAIKKYGQYHMPLKYKFKMAYIMLKEHMSIEEGTKLYLKYVENWGNSVTKFRFEAIKNNEVVKVIEKKPVDKISLHYDISTTELREEETYDVAEIRITAVDENGNRLPYYQEPITLETWGAIDLIGPKTISLKGGATGVYIKTIGVSGEGELRIHQEDNLETIIKFNVEISL